MPVSKRLLSAGITPTYEIALVVFWSSGFVAAHMASTTPSIFLVLLWRFIITALVLLPFTLAAIPKYGFARLSQQAGIGVLAMFGYLAFGVAAIDLGVPLGTAALIAALQPLATAACAGFFLNEAVKGRQWLGLLIGFVGVAVAVSGSISTAPLWAYLLSAASMACIVAATLITKRVSGSMPVMPTLGIQSLVSALLFVPLALYEGYLLPQYDADFIEAVAWFVVFSTCGYGFYWLCLRRSSATRVASLIYLTPPVTGIWAWAMFGQPITIAAIAGFGICLFGVWLARKQTPV